MRRSILAAVLLIAACSTDVEGGPAFGSGASGATANTTTATSTSGDDGSGAASESPETTAADTEDASGTTSSASGPTSNAPTSDGEDSSGSATTAVSGETSTSDTAATGDGTPLDPDLDVPDGGEACTTPGSLNECPGIAVCRFYTAEEGRCESCDTCGNLGAPCTEGTDCDILFACYAGRCTNICPLGTSYCGPVEDCLDVGHPSHGVCDPFA